ncbi:hypothetical protein BRN03_01550 [Xanthomonas oryzae pv. oryzae]|nr:hypothetical protein EBA19_24635 [Xanthomonas oryzae pv. oryzae]RBA68650.1 hypothetical protein BRN68_18770 [Xanthomonas oryzae pv. oryzae]RBB46260.1 hypothetical protein BRN58_03140 [Xanthomonas oryzae pv. oryzae]RBC23377.1 hypothetical protein BRN37_15485 [Xanthomonas oryzae pv. oryzae]RBC52738.1 hypothetical protein BRN44_16105 [Xanthomonas oryzae pv. oryzae]
MTLSSFMGRRCPAGADEGVGEASCYPTLAVASPRTLTPPPAPRPSTRQRRVRSKTRARSAREPCLLAPQERGRLLRSITEIPTASSQSQPQRRHNR